MALPLVFSPMMKSGERKQADLARQLTAVLRGMDYVAKHWLKDGRVRRARLFYDIYQALGTAWNYYALQCAHRKGYRKVSSRNLACRQCGSIKGTPAAELLLPVRGAKTIGRFVAAPRLGGPVRKNESEAALVNDTIRFHGAKLKVQVHHSYPSTLLGSKMAIAAGREVYLRERGTEVCIDDHLIDVRFLRKPKTKGARRGSRKRPIYGGFPHELPKKLLSKFPVLFSYDAKGRLEEIEIFKPKPRT